MYNRQVEVVCAPGDFPAVKAAFEKAGLKPELAEITPKATTEAALEGDEAGRMRRLCAVRSNDEVKRRLAALRQIRYVKESTGEMPRITELLRRCGDRLGIFCGCDTIALESLIRRFIKEPIAAYKPKKGPETDPRIIPILNRGMTYVDEWAQPGGAKPAAGEEPA